MPWFQIEKDVQGGAPITHSGSVESIKSRASFLSDLFLKSHGSPLSLRVLRSKDARPSTFKFLRLAIVKSWMDRPYTLIHRGEGSMEGLTEQIMSANPAGVVSAAPAIRSTSIMEFVSAGSSPIAESGSSKLPKMSAT